MDHSYQRPLHFCAKLLYTVILEIKTDTLDTALSFKAHSDILLKALRAHATLNSDSDILISGNDSHLTITGYDTRSVVTSTIPAEITNSGQCSVSVKLLHDLIKSSSGFWSIQSSRTLELSYASGSYSIPLVEAPVPLPAMQSTNQCEISGPSFAKMVRYASIGSGTHYPGINLHFTKNTLRIISTDGLRLSYMTHPVSTPSEAKLTLHKDLIATISKWPEQKLCISYTTPTEPVEFCWSSDTVDYRIRLNTLPDSIPDNYENLVPKSGQTITVNGKDLASALQRTSLFTSDQTRRVMLEPRGSQLAVRSSSINVGSGDELLAAENSDKAQKWCINAKMISDLQLEGNITLQGAATGPIRLITNDPDWIYVFMPLAAPDLTHSGI